MKKFLVTISPLVVALLVWSSVASGQPAPDTTPAPSQPGQQVICRGDRNWDVFISSTLSMDNFSEYWKDILERYYGNICLYEDIQSIRKRLIKAREQIRSAFYACADTAQLSRTYYTLEAELFFLRKYIDVDNGQILVKNENLLWQEMKQYFVENKGFFSEDELKTVFDRLLARYKSKLKTYENCEDPSWQSLIDKWNEFRDTAGGITPAFKQAEESAKKRWDRMANTDLNLGRDFLGGYLDARINGLPPEEGLDEILEELESNLPEAVKISDLQVAQAVAERERAFNFNVAESLSQYEALYRESSDEFTRRMVHALDLLKRMIDDSFKYQNQTIQCTKFIKDKQC